MFDRLVDGQKERVIRDTLTIEHAMLAVENALEKCDQSGNPLVSKIDDALAAAGIEPRFLAELMNEFLLSYALGEEGVQAASDEPTIRPPMRKRFKRHARRDVQEVHPDWSKDQVADYVEAKVTDEKIAEAIKKHVVKTQGVQACEGIADWWQWLKDNWSWSTFFSILGLILMFI